LDIDELHVFHTGVDFGIDYAQSGEDVTDTYTYLAPLNVLVLGKAGSEIINANSPLMAFGKIHVMTGLYAKAEALTVNGLKAKAAKKAKAKITWKANKDASGYQIQYSLKKNFKGAKTVKINKASTKSAVLKKLKAGKKYYVRMRTVTNIKNPLTKKSEAVYGAWTKTKSFKAKK